MAKIVIKSMIIEHFVYSKCFVYLFDFMQSKYMKAHHAFIVIS